MREPRDTLILAKVTKTDKAFIYAASAAAGVTVSTLIRDAALASAAAITAPSN